MYLNEFHHLSVKELIRKINQAKESGNRWGYCQEEVWATFVKESDKIGIIADMPVCEGMMRDIGICFYGDKTQRTLCVLSEKQYTKEHWSYKITLVPENKEYNGYIGSKNLYFSDFCSMLLRGQYIIVDLEEYKRNRRAAKYMYKKGKPVSPEDEIYMTF